MLKVIFVQERCALAYTVCWFYHQLSGGCTYSLQFCTCQVTLSPHPLYISLRHAYQTIPYTNLITSQLTSLRIPCTPHKSTAGNYREARLIYSESLHIYRELNRQEPQFMLCAVVVWYVCALANSFHTSCVLIIAINYIFPWAHGAYHCILRHIHRTKRQLVSIVVSDDVSCNVARHNAFTFQNDVYPNTHKQLNK